MGRELPYQVLEMHNHGEKINPVQAQVSQRHGAEFRRAPDWTGIYLCEETIQQPSIYEMKNLNPCLLTSVSSNLEIIKDKDLFFKTIKYNIFLIFVGLS